MSDNPESESESEAFAEIDNTGRQPAQRLSAHELRDIEKQVKDKSEIDGDEDDENTNAPRKALTGTGGAVNRVLIAGTLTEVSNRGSEDDPYYRARIVTQSGTVFVYAGQYQPDAQAWLREAGTPSYVMCMGKIRLYEADDADSDDIFTSVRPEWIRSCSEAQRDRWMVNMANETLDRIEQTLNADGVSADGVPTGLYEAQDLSREGMEPYLETAIEALEEVNEHYEASSGASEMAEVDHEAEAQAVAGGDD